MRLESGVGYGEARLVVADNGRGMPAEMPGRGSGLSLISALGRKIGAKIKRESSERGTSVTVQFPIIP